MLTGDRGPSDAWRGTPRARLFVHYEHRLLAQLLPRLTGYRCVQVDGLGGDRKILESAATLRQWRIGPRVTSGVDACFDGLHLPLASASVDALVLSHGLEAIEAPHALLRECARVLNDRGQIIVLVFNPLSLWFWRQHLLASRQPCYRFCAAPPRAARLCDWLRLLEFEPEQVWRYGVGAPLFGRLWRAGGADRWLRWLAWSAQAYAVVARRHVAPRTPLAAKYRKRRRAPAVAVARQPSHRVKSRK